MAINKENLQLASANPIYRLPVRYETRGFAYSPEFLANKAEWTKENNIIRDIFAIQREARSIHLDHSPFSQEALFAGSLLAAYEHELHQADLMENSKLIKSVEDGLSQTVTILTSKSNPNLIAEAFRVKRVIKSLELDHRASSIAYFI